MARLYMSLNERYKVAKRGRINMQFNTFDLGMLDVDNDLHLENIKMWSDEVSVVGNGQNAQE